MKTHAIMPEIVVTSDYEGCFEHMVRSWCARKTGPFREKTIEITAGPYRPSAVSYQRIGDTLHLDFYSALRRGFGALSEADVNDIINDVL